MSKIPEAREMFTDALELIEAAMELLTRRKSHYRAKGTRAPSTPLLALKIRVWAMRHPGWTQQRIAEKFNVTNGRVSEALHGKHQ